MLDHGPEPLSGRDRHAGGCLALPLEVRVTQRADHGSGLGVEALEILKQRLVTVGQLPTAAGVAAGPAGLLNLTSVAAI
ncbi:MAG: hypothetical protein ABJC36_07080 [Gemmatimonadales bacterium]